MRLLALLRDAGLDGVLLSHPGNIAWYTGGGRAYIVHSVAPGIADLLVSSEGDVVYTDQIEASRLMSEEFPDLDAAYSTRPWWNDRASYLPRGSRLGSDSALPGYVDAGPVVRRARQELMSVELERYRALGRDTAEALTETALALTPKMTEYRAAAHLSGGLLERHIEPILLLIAGAERLPLYRHPLLTASNLGARAMLVAVTCRNGLIASLTRMVAFAPLPPAERDRMVRLLAVESAFLSSTRPGRRLADVFAEGVAAYTKLGFEADEWHLHHQGGPTGYFGRDEFATHRSDSHIVEAQAFAWSASVPGLKVEDTVVTTSANLEILTHDDAWPTMEVSRRARPLVLER